jgi:hypothetical protein
MPATSLKSPRTSQYAATPKAKAPSLSPNEGGNPTISQVLAELDRRQRRVEGLERALDAKQKRIEALERAAVRRYTTLIGEIGLARALFAGVLFIGGAYLFFGATIAAWASALMLFIALPVPVIKR